MTADQCSADGKVRSVAKKKTTKRAGTKSGRRRYWLFKSEPNEYSIDDLAREKQKITYWDGVRNYQARNMLRDDIQVGDGVLFYYSRIEPMGIAGAMQVVRAGYPDHTALDPNDKHFDPKSTIEEPRWYMVDVQLVRRFPEFVTRDALKEASRTKGMMVLKRGSRLSIQPVTESEWNAVHQLAGVSGA